MRTVPPMDTMTKRNFMSEKRSEVCEGKTALRMSVNRPDVEERIFTTGAEVRLNAIWYEYWPTKNGSENTNAC